MNIAISANRQDEEPSRIDRLEEVAAALREAHLQTPLAGLHDSKGTLYVNFAGRPWTMDVLAVGRIWADQGECTMNVYANGEPICWDVGGYNPFGGPDT